MIGSRRSKRKRQPSPDSPPSKKQGYGKCSMLAVHDEIARNDSYERGSSPGIESEESVSSRPSPSAISLSNVIQTTFSRQPLDISSWIPSFQSLLKEFCPEAHLVFSKDSPAVILYVLHIPAGKDRVAEKERMEGLVHDMTRDVTSVLQAFMTSPICIVPVFVDRRVVEGCQSEEAARLLQEAVNTSLCSTKRLIPYGRWLMTDSKLKALQEAAVTVSTKLIEAKLE